MPLPWLQLIDAALGIANFARGRKAPAASADQQLQAGGRDGSLDARLPAVVVAALKEAFDRDSRRMQLEREQLEAERERAERAMQLELLRQAGDREIGRLRLLAGVAVVSWFGTLFFSSRLISGGTGPRVALGGGWLLLLAAIAASFTAQSRVAAALDPLTQTLDGTTRGSDISSGLSGALALWLIVCGLALVALAVLIA
jgi:hypothetical protein